MRCAVTYATGSICSYLKSVLGYKFLILDTYTNTLFVREEGCEDPWLY
jgi:hypothetical protein